MKRFWSVFGVGAVLLAGPSPVVGQLPVRNPAIRILIPADANSHPATGSQTVYLVAGGLGAGAFVGSGGSWVALERRVSTQPVLWNFLGNTSVGDNTWEAIVEVMSFYHGSHRIAGAHGVISWPEVTLRFYYRCSYGGPNYSAYIRVGAGTRVGILGGHPTSEYSLGYEILDTVIVRCSHNETNAVEGAWVSDSYGGRWFDIESLLSTNQVGARVVTNRISVGDLTVREVVVNVDSNTVTTVNVLSNEVLSVVGATGTVGQQLMGSVIGGAIVRSVGGGGGPGDLQVAVTVTNHVNVDWAEGYQYGREQLPSTNWSWVIGSVQGSVAESLGEPVELSGVSLGHAVASPTWSIPVRMPSGVWSWNFDLGIWTSGLGGVVKRVLEVLVLLGLWFMLHRQIVDDLRSAWGAPQARSAGQTVLGTGSQLAGALVAAAAILATLLTLSAAVLAWFLGGVGYPNAWVGELSLPAGLLGQFLRIGPWEVIVSSLTVWAGVWLARPYWIALTHGVVRFITGV